MYYTHEDALSIHTQANVVQVHATVLNATRCVVSDGTVKDLGGLNVLLHAVLLHGVYSNTLYMSSMVEHTTHMNTS